MRYRILVTKISIAWYKKFEFHRLYGPAYEHRDGTKWWYKDGKCHHEDGPAREYPDGDRMWGINGIPYSEKEFQNLKI